jgi:hypothetical protein
MTVLNGCTLEIVVDQVLGGQGIDATSPSPRLPALRAAAERVLQEYRGLLEPRVVSRRLAVIGADAAAVRFEGGPSIEDPGVAGRLRGASEVVFAVCTVGEPISRHAAAAMGRDPVAALAIEGLACAGVDAVAAAFCTDEWQLAAGRGCRVTPPLSPGMDEWPLDTGQRAIFGVVDAASIGVRLTESGQMYPAKSTSFVFGVGADVWQDEGGGCSRCAARDRCRWRVRKAAGGRQ